MFLNKFCSLNVYLKPLCIMFAGIRTNFSKNICLVFGWFSSKKSKIAINHYYFYHIIFCPVTDGNRDQVPSLGRIKLTTSDEKFKKSFPLSLFSRCTVTNKQMRQKRNNEVDFPRKLYDKHYQINND